MTTHDWSKSPSESEGSTGNHEVSHVTLHIAIESSTILDVIQYKASKRLLWLLADVYYKLLDE